jgi:arylsulfatase A-like enzyme
MTPNILYIHSHDTGRCISPYGFPVRTPNLKAFAEDAVVFRQAFCANPTCSPSRAALLTGQCAHSAGSLGLSHLGFDLNEAQLSRHMVQTLAAHGYRSALSGIQHIAKNPGIIGYDEKLETATWDAQGISDAAAAFIARSHSAPFFLSVGFPETHRGFKEVDPEDDPRWAPPIPTMPDTIESRADMAGFQTKAKRLDDGIGRVLKAVDEAGLRENTLVIITTDHGIPFPNMKCSLYDGGIGVLLMLRGPRFGGGQVIDAMVSQLDLFPTLCDLVGIEKPAWLQGKSLLPLVAGDVATLHEEVFAELNFHAAYEPMRCVRTVRHKYIRRFGGNSRVTMVNQSGESRNTWIAAGWQSRPVAEEELYDLTFDPHESNNLIGDARCTDVAEDLRGRLDRWMRATDDPLLDGPLPLKPGYQFNWPDALTTADPVFKVPNVN